MKSLAQGEMYGCAQSKVNKTTQEEEEEREKKAGVTCGPGSSVLDLHGDQRHIPPGPRDLDRVIIFLQMVLSFKKNYTVRLFS